MRHGDVDLSRWNPEARVLLVAQLLWFVHGGLMSVHRYFALTWAAHALIVGVWGYSYLWRSGSQAHRRWKAWHQYYATRKCHACGAVAGDCHICHARPGERCDAGLHG